MTWTATSYRWEGSHLAFNTLPEKHTLSVSHLQLPYRGNISMLIALPRKITGMRTLEQDISPTVVSKWLKNMTNRSAGVSRGIK